MLFSRLQSRWSVGHSGLEDSLVGWGLAWLSFCILPMKGCLCIFPLAWWRVVIDSSIQKRGRFSTFHTLRILMIPKKWPDPIDGWWVVAKPSYRPPMNVNGAFLWGEPSIRELEIYWMWIVKIFVVLQMRTWGNLYSILEGRSAL